MSETPIAGQTNFCFSLIPSYDSKLFSLIQILCSFPLCYFEDYNRKYIHINLYTNMYTKLSMYVFVCMYIYTTRTYKHIQTTHSSRKETPLIFAVVNILNVLSKYYSNSCGFEMVMLLEI
jgi:uncharacterized membrane protein YoaT (DUF817 family)